MKYKILNLYLKWNTSYCFAAKVTFEASVNERKIETNNTRCINVYPVKTYLVLKRKQMKRENCQD